MFRRSSQHLLFVLPICIIWQCHPNTKHQPSIVLDSVANKFIKEANKRGLNINLKKDSLLLAFGKLEPEENGICTPGTYPKVVTIDSSKWKSNSTLWQEYVIFHELGHCLLGRKHRNDTLETGACASLLKEGNVPCHFDYADQAWKKYYLDELFDPLTPPPSWLGHYTKNNNSSDKPIKSIQIDKGVVRDTLQLSRIGKFNIDIQCYLSQSKKQALYLTLNSLLFSITLVNNYPIGTEQNTSFIVQRTNDNFFQSPWLVLKENLKSNERQVRIRIEKSETQVCILLNGKACHILHSIDLPLKIMAAQEGLESAIITISKGTI